MKGTLFALALLFTPGCGGDAPEGEQTVELTDEAEETFRQLKRRYSAGEFEAVAAELTTFLESYPEHDLGWTLLGHARRSENLPIAAKAAYRKAVEVNPLRVEAFIGLGVVSRLEGDLAEAMRNYERALSIEPFHAHAHSSAAIIQVMRDRMPEAILSAERALELDPEDATIAANAAVVYHYDGRTAQRDEMAEKALALGYDKPEKFEAIFSGAIDIRPAAE